MKKKFSIIVFVSLVLTTSTLAQFLGGSGSGYSSITYAEGPLPVEFTSFTASVSKEGVLLAWVTQSEIKNYGFEVERFSEKETSNWLSIGFIQGSGTSQNVNKYNYFDDNTTAGKYYYRLKQIDNDGKYEYSTSILVTVGIPNEIYLDQNYPNPFNPSTSIKFSIVEQSFVNLSVYNVIGEKVATLVNETFNAGIHKINFDASNLNSGIYFYKIEVNDFIKTNKMQLIK